MPTGYHHLTYDQRCQIYILKERGDAPSAIAKALDVHRCSINLSFFLSSRSVDIFDEIAGLLPEGNSQSTIFESKNEQSHEKIDNFERRFKFEVQQLG